MQRSEEFDALDELRKHGPLPRELEQRHQRLRRQQFYKAGLECDRYPPPSTSRLENADMTIADWLRVRWSSADKTVRNALQAVASAVGASIPMSRTRDSSAGVKDSSPTRRTKPAPQPYVEQDTLDSLAGLDPQFRNDPPAWHDDDADGWEPCESLHDAMHPEDRGWY